jgi:hypothetical protein
MEALPGLFRIYQIFRGSFLPIRTNQFKSGQPGFNEIRCSLTAA